MANKKAKAEPHYTKIPTEIELFGRTIKTIMDTANLNRNKTFGEARYGVNQIALTNKIGQEDIPADEMKVTYLHELVHFILNFTGFEMTLSEKGIDIEQFVDLVATALFQYEKTAKY
jgi:hypothetical protein